MKWSNVINAL